MLFCGEERGDVNKRKKKKWECVKAHMKVDGEEDILKKTRNNENNVEHGPETVDVLLNMSDR